MLGGYITTLLTPTSLFLFLNLIIGTIVITSRLAKKNHQPHNDHPHHYQLARAPSLLERVRSVNFSFHKFSGPELHAASYGPLDIDQRFYGHDQETTPFMSETSQVLQRAPSLFERVKSIGSSFVATTYQPLNKDQQFYEHHQETTAFVSETTQALQRAPSLLERVKSFGSSFVYRSDKKTNVIDEPKPDTEDHHIKRSKSEPKESPTEQQSSEKIKKSASEKAMDVGHEELEAEEETEMVEKRRPTTTTSLEKTVSFGDEGVDAKCDDFINRFKQQLKLQRLDSLARYRDMLKR